MDDKPRVVRHRQEAARAEVHPKGVIKQPPIVTTSSCSKAAHFAFIFIRASIDHVDGAALGGQVDEFIVRTYCHIYWIRKLRRVTPRIALNRKIGLGSVELGQVCSVGIEYLGTVAILLHYEYIPSRVYRYPPRSVKLASVCRPVAICPNCVAEAVVVVEYDYPLPCPIWSTAGRTTIRHDQAPAGVKGKIARRPIRAVGIGIVGIATVIRIRNRGVSSERVERVVHHIGRRIIQQEGRRQGGDRRNGQCEECGACRARERLPALLTGIGAPTPSNPAQPLRTDGGGHNGCSAWGHRRGAQRGVFNHSDGLVRVPAV